MDLVMLYGPPAVGKLTVARALATRTGFKLFHNHLVLDAVTAVFDYRSPSYLRLREQWWLEMFAVAAREHVSLIFTFMPETSVAPGLAERVATTVGAEGGRLRLVELACDVAVQEGRMNDPSRAAFAKLTSAEVMRDLRAQGWLDYAMPPPELVVDTGAHTPDEAAATIQQRLGLPQV